MENRKRYTTFFFLFMILVGSLVIGFRSFFMVYIIEPIALLCWTAWRIISSIDQNIYWAMLIVISAILVLYQLLPGKEAAPRSLYKEKQNSPNRVEHWQKLITDSAAGGDKSDQLRDSLKGLFGSMIAEKTQPGPIDMDELIAKGRVSLPLAVQRFLFPPEQESVTLQEKIMGLAPEWFRNWTSKLSKRDKSVIEEMLRWMENELEINNGK